MRAKVGEGPGEGPGEHSLMHVNEAGAVAKFLDGGRGLAVYSLGV